MLHSIRRRLLPLLVTLPLMLAHSLPADELDEKYLRILSAVDQADELQRAGKTTEARAKYQVIQTALLELKKADPSWKANMVAHRLEDVRAQLEALAPKAPTEVAEPSRMANPAPSTRTPVAAAAELSALKLKLLDAGQEPRQQLRLKPLAGSKQDFAVASGGAIEIAAAGNPPQKVEQPETKLSMQLSVEDVLPSGDIRFTCTIGDASMNTNSDAPAAMSQVLRATLEKAKGTTLSLHINDRGENQAPIKYSSELSAQTKTELGKFVHALSEFTGAFPEDAVGLGAKWEIKESVNQGGIAISQTTTYQITSIANGQLELQFSQSQTAANQKVAVPTMPGMKTDLEKLNATTTGTVRCDLAKLAPLTGESKSTGDMRMSINVLGQKQSMDMKMATHAAVTSK